MSTASVRAYSLGLLAYMAIKVLATAYYAQQDMRTPVKIGVIAMLANMIMNLIFVAIFHYYWSMGHAGLALATSCSAFLNAGLLLRGLRHNALLRVDESNASILDSAFWHVLTRVLAATFLMSSLLWWFVPEHTYWLASTFWPRLMAVAALCSSGAGLYFIALYLFGLRWHDFKGAV